jgi:hypothetical protein
MGSFDMSMTRRTAIAGLAAGTATGGLATTMAGPADADPIFAAIEEHRRALAAHVAAIDGGVDTDGTAEEELDALEALLRCEPEPTTIGGVVALLDYLGESEDGVETILSTAMVSLAEQSARDFPAALADALRRLLDGKAA